MTDRLGHKQTAAMFALLALGREVPNPELKEIAGFTLDSKERVDLNKRGYVTSEKRGRALAHTITEEGIAWCRGEIDQRMSPPPRPRSLMVHSFYLLLGTFNDYLQREKLDVTDVFTQQHIDLGSEEIEKRIKAAYRTLAGKSHDWVGLVDLRPLLGAVVTERVDEVLKELSRTGRISLVPESNRKALGTADHKAAIRIGGEDNHLIAIETS
jgi:hypothetical protein